MEYGKHEKIWNRCQEGTPGQSFDPRDVLINTRCRSAVRGLSRQKRAFCAKKWLLRDNKLKRFQMTPANRQRVVLLADDDVVLRNLARLALEGAGFRVLPAADGLEALKLLRVHPEGVDILVRYRDTADGWNQPC